MSMTRDEIIEAYESAVFSSELSAAAGNEQAAKDYELLKAGLDALRGPTREMVERMRFPWERIADAYGNTEGFLCECGHMDNSASNFCRYCGLPKTDEAVDILWQRWKEALDNDN